MEKDQHTVIHGFIEQANGTELKQTKLSVLGQQAFRGKSQYNYLSPLFMEFK